MLVSIKRKQKGFTLIELMIAMMLGLIVIGGAMSIYISTIKSSSDVVKSVRLNYDLDSVMQLMVNDIRRAGYWGGAVAGSDAENNPFTEGNANIIISDYTDADGVTHTDGCILYTYDSDNTDNGTEVPVLPTNLSSYYGFRFDRDSIWVRSSVTAAERTANTVGCGNGSWEQIIDEDKILISKLKFSPDAGADAGKEFKDYKCLNVTTSITVNASCADMVTAGTLLVTEQAAELRQINIYLDGVVLNGDSVTKTLTAIVKVRNNRIFTQ